MRAADVDVVLNLTAGMGGDLVLGGADAPLPAGRRAGPTWSARAERLAHVEELRPEICTLDCGTMNFAAGGDYVMVNTPGMLRAMAERIRELGVRPELEVFDTGHLVMVNELVRDGLIDDPALIQLCMGIPYGAPDDPTTLLAMVDAAAARTRCSRRSRSAACSCRTSRSPRSRAATCGSASRTTSTSRAACSATNAELVERAVTILEAMNVRVLGPDEVREKLALVRHG